MGVLPYLAVWIGASFPLALLVGRFIAVGSGKHFPCGTDHRAGVAPSAGGSEQPASGALCSNKINPLHGELDA